MREIFSEKRGLKLSVRLYGLLLAAYPAEFRREYGPHMAQLFQDRCRDGQRRRSRGARGSLLRVWAETILDLARTAPDEHLRNGGRGVQLMKALLKIAAALVAYVVLFMLAGKFLLATREHLPYLITTLLDSLISIGILFNFLFLIFNTTGWLKAVRAVVISGIVTAALVIMMVVAISLGSPASGPGGAAILGLVVSFLFWFGVHWWWAQRRSAARQIVA